MKKFAFALEPVLNLKRRREDLLLEELAQRQRAARAAEEALHRLVAERRRIRTELGELLRGRIDVERLWIIQDYLSGLDGRLAFQRREVERRTAEVQACRRELLVAQQERKAFEKLRERQWEAYQKDCRREEQAFLDELAAQGYARQR